ncbi:MAG: hypothetical protein ABII25_06715 [bacterium]
MSTSIEKISLIALAGIFIAVVSLFLGKEKRAVFSVIVESKNTAKTYLDSARSRFGEKNYASAISEYRKAIEIEPNYIDQKSDFFLGDEIKSAIKKTIFELTEKEKKYPDDKTVRQGLKDAYYLRRKFGSGCE